MPDEPKMPSSIAGLENFTLSEPEEKSADYSDADSFFNLPDTDEDEDEDDDGIDPRRSK
jgi:hypothetical protein